MKYSFVAVFFWWPVGLIGGAFPLTRKHIYRPLLVLMLCVSFLAMMPVSSSAQAQDSPLVLAFYYAWYDLGTWASDLTPDQPAQPYASSDPAIIDRHVSQAQAAGIDAFIQSWYGPQEEDNQTESNFRTLLDVAATQGFRVAVDFETTGPFFPDKASVTDALRYLLSVHAKHPAYLRYQGRPVVFFWRQERFSVDEWAAIRRELDPDHGSLWIAEGVDVSYQAVFDGSHLYSIAWSPDVEHTLTDWGYRIRRYESQNGQNRLWVATVMPGYDDTHTDRKDAFAVGRRGGTYYRDTWSAALASQPDWIVITSFNEWVEGTMIEPSLSYGDLYLNLTRELAAEFKSGNKEADASEHQGEVDGPEPEIKRQETLTSTLTAPYIRVEEAVRVRSGPGTKYQDIGRLWPGEKVSVLGRDFDSTWWQIEFTPADDRIGWVIAEYVTLVGDQGLVPVIDNKQTPTPTLTPSSTPIATPTSVPTTHTPSHTAQTTFTPNTRATRRPSTLTPTFVPAPISTHTPTPVPTPTDSSTAPAISTSTLTLRTTPVVQRRPVGLLWLGSGALAVALGLGVFLFLKVQSRR